MENPASVAAAPPAIWRASSGATRRSQRRIFRLRAGRALLAASALLFALLPLATRVRAQQTARAKELGKKLLCVCGCGQILVYCNHVGCPYSSGMIKELDAHVARGDSESVTLSAFVQEYGQTVLAEPPASGFNWLAWIMPVIVPLLALLIVWQLVRRWRRRAVCAPADGPEVPAEFLARAHNEAATDEEA